MLKKTLQALTLTWALAGWSVYLYCAFSNPTYTQQMMVIAYWPVLLVWLGGTGAILLILEAVKAKE